MVGICLRTYCKVIGRGPKDKDLHYKLYIDAVFSARNKKQKTLISADINKKAACKRQPVAHNLTV
jgi:hypothetical protein